MSQCQRTDDQCHRIGSMVLERDLRTYVIEREIGFISYAAKGLIIR